MKSIILLLVVALLTGCMSREKKSSSLQALVGEPGPAIEAKTIRENLSRYGHIMAESKNKKRSYRTGTWLKVYPFTKPLAVASTTEDINEKAFKEKWSAAKKAKALKNLKAKIAKMEKTNETCFLAEIHSNDVQASQTKYWYGSLVQGDAKVDLKFSKGTGFADTDVQTVTETEDGVSRSTTYSTTTYYHFAQACAKTKTDFSKAFSMQIEPRYKMHVMPTEFVWEKPNSDPLNKSRNKWKSGQK